jgi:predicted RNA-binding Zn ribbon-like protein
MVIEDHDASDWSHRAIEDLELVGGAVCLDFANTVGGTRANPKERLHAYEDLVQWSARAGGLEAKAVDPLLALAAERPDEAARVHARALALREAIYRIFASLVGEHAPAAADLAILNDELARALPHLRIEPREEGFGYRFADAPALDRPLWGIARSASELLTSGEIPHLKECSSDDCTWLFLDQSRNQSRRWCDMKDCGNRAKARRHYHRQKRSRRADSRQS